jgi:hypothetical protein
MITFAPTPVQNPAANVRSERVRKRLIEMPGVVARQQTRGSASDFTVFRVALQFSEKREESVQRSRHGFVISPGRTVPQPNEYTAQAHAVLPNVEVYGAPQGGL